jgi:heptosyltransferase-1
MARLNILLVRVSSLGDVLHNLPIVADILRHHPDATIDWVVEEAYVSLVRLNPHVGRIIPFALRRWRKSLGKKETRDQIRTFFKTLREQQYDYVIDPQGLLKTGIIMGAARIVRGGSKIGLANGSVGSGYEGISRLFHTRSVKVEPHSHAVAFGRLMAAAAFGYQIDGAPDFGLPAPDKRNLPAWMPAEEYAVFFHGTSRDAKKWASANWIAAGQALAPMPVLLAWGSPAEKQEAETIAAGLPNASVLPKLSMDEAVTLARNAALVMGVDTGLTHISAAFVRPTVELFCDTARWRYEGNWSPRIINLGDVGAPPSAAEAIAAARSLLGTA